MATHVLVDTDTVQTITDKNLTDCTITNPVLSGTATGTYTLAGTPTISGPTISGPSVTGILTVAGSIKFPATQAASADVNTLDDYEEGTWTPSVGGSATYTVQTGTYVKIGKQVNFMGQLTINSLGTGSASVISGLPFANNGTHVGPVSIGPFGTLATSVVALYGRVTASGGSSISFIGATAAAVNNTATSTIFTNSSSIEFSGFYFIS